ncbi:MAG: hypothetical protein EZS28_002595 [Streblomastix strix]|uniref:Uncharacterized protein n=1 Tax=Streblomastix strix TaxID=222440 RepID=A0A5J4X3I1_9EUKA|nr:MAG: hypothetical protein EZS28_002595 [Streblomastix strix]
MAEMAGIRDGIKSPRAPHAPRAHGYFTSILHARTHSHQNSPRAMHMHSKDWTQYLFCTHLQRKSLM